MKKLLVFGANKNCINKIANDLNWGNYGKEFEIIGFLDNSEKIQNTYIEKGYYYPLNKKRVLPFEHIKVDSVSNISSYEYDYIYIAADAKEAILDQLSELGVALEKILIHTFCLQSGYLNYPDLGNGGKTFEDICPQELLNDNLLFRKYLKEFGELGDIIIGNTYKKRIFQLQLNVIESFIKKDDFLVGGFKYSYHVFSVNPSLFFYECMDIVFGSIDEELDEIYFGEGPYENGNVMIGKEDIVIDAGANYGLFTSVAGKKAQDGHVYAFEPVSRTRKILEYSVDKMENVTIVPRALSDREEIVKMDITDYESNPGGATMTKNSVHKDIEEVKSIRIDTFVKENNIKKIDFIKADIEGAERLLLKGAFETLKTHSPKLAICTYHYDDDPQVLEALIKEANPEYVVEHQFKKLYGYVPK